MTTYRVIRYYRKGAPPAVTHEGLTEEQAKEIVGKGMHEDPNAPHFLVYAAE